MAEEPWPIDKKAAEAAYSLHVLFVFLELLLSLFGKTPELLQVIHGGGALRQEIVTEM
ncbi:MAG: hypothetical protein ACSLE2_12375 [Lysobacterales bacterium]